MNAVSSYIMYVMNKKELFHNIHLHQVFLPTLLVTADPLVPLILFRIDEWCYASIIRIFSH